MMMVVYFAWGLLVLHFPLPSVLVLAAWLADHHLRRRRLTGWRLPSHRPHGPNTR